MPCCDTDTTLTARRRIAIGIREEKPVETTDSKHAHHVRGRALHYELATGGCRRLRRVDGALDPARVQERQAGGVDRNRGRSILQEFPEEPTKRLDGREIELAGERHDD